MTASEFFARHERVLFQLSAGKDSATCLWLLQDWWDRMDIVWGSSGNPHPEVVEYMMSIAEQVPSFLVVEGNQKAWIKQYGYPVDVLPFTSTVLGHTAKISDGPVLALMSECCGANLWAPLANLVSSGGYTGVIRGQKASDELKAPLKSGSVVEGVEYYFPIEDWTDEQIVEYLGPRIPYSYTRGLRSSLDCLDCTAYAGHQPGYADDLEAGGYPEAAATIRKVHLYLKGELTEYLKRLES